MQNIKKKLKILLIEPFYSGSHKSWADNYAQNSVHSISIISLKGIYWKWRMHGGAISRLINDIDITCLASNLPEYIEVDVEALDIGDSIFLSALNLPEGVEIPSLALGEDRDQAVVSVAEAKILEIETEIVEPEEGEEASEDEGEAVSEDSEGDSEDSEEKSE